VARNERIARSRRFRREQEAAAMQHNAAEEKLNAETETALCEWLDHEIDALPAKYRQPLAMIHLEGQDPATVATKLRCKEKAPCGSG
jgi:DNA-directed RNA polymerase specialized sigma24 family protein